MRLYGTSASYTGGCFEYGQKHLRWGHLALHRALLGAVLKREAGDRNIRRIMGSNHPRLRSKPRGRGELDPSCTEVYEARPRLTSGRELFWAKMRLGQYGRIVAYRSLQRSWTATTCAH